MTYEVRRNSLILGFYSKKEVHELMKESCVSYNTPYSKIFDQIQENKRVVVFEFETENNVNSQDVYLIRKR